MKANLIQYEHSMDTPWYMKMTLNNSSVAVGEAAGAGDGQEWEIIDGFNGKQLAFRRLTDDHTTPADIWPDLMMKAHCELLTLEQMAKERAKREADFVELMKAAADRLANMTHVVDQMQPSGVTDTQVAHLRNCVEFLDQADEAMDEAYDPEI